MHDTMLASLAGLESAELLEAAARLASDERGATVALVVHLAEIERRDLHLREGFGSMFAYCTGALQLSEGAAYARILAARTAVRFPLLLDLLLGGDVNLTTVTRLAAHLTAENHQEVLHQARGMTRSQLDELVARLKPKPDVPTTVRRVPPPAVPPAESHPEGTGPAAPVARGPALPGVPASGAAGVASPSAQPGPPVSAVAAPPVPALVVPLAPERYKLQLTIGRSALDKLRQAQELLRRTGQAGDDGALLERALDALLVELERRRLGRETKPARGARPAKPGSRHVPTAVRRTVHARDRGQCAYVGLGGRRCAERAHLEFHHVKPYMAGGEATTANIELRCRAHNAFEARVYFARPDPTAVNGVHIGGQPGPTPSGRSWPSP